MLIKTQPKELIQDPRFIYPILQIALALSLLYEQWLIGLAVTSLMFSCVIRLQSYSKRTYLLTHFAGTALYITTALWWFRNISTASWFGNLWLLSASQWLMFGAITIALMCSIIQIPLVIMLRACLEKYRSNNWVSLYAYAVFVMLSMWLFAIGISFYFKASSTPIEPFWNFHTIGLFVSDSPLRPLTSIFGLWGSSFFFVFLSGTVFIAGRYFVTSKKTDALKVGMGVTFSVLLLFTLTSVTRPTISAEQQNVILTNQPNGDSNFLSAVSQRLEAQGKTPQTLLVLPEYSGLQLSPLVSGDSPSISNFSLANFKETLAEKDIYISSTESEYTNNTRYAESYLANSELTKVKRLQKRFLVPGGEYIFWWGETLLKNFDPTSTIDFVSKRSHRVLAEPPTATVDDPFAKTVAIGACSAVLAPHLFTNQIRGGAGMITINSSFEQFTKAQEYEKYTRRYARFISVSTAKPLVLAARGGESFALNHLGETITESTETTKDISLEPTSGTTIYTKTGDTFWLISLLLPLAVVLIIERRRKTTTQNPAPRRRASKQK